jgi:hypothetical protein
MKTLFDLSKEVPEKNRGTSVQPERVSMMDESRNAWVFKNSCSKQIMMKVPHRVNGERN